MPITQKLNVEHQFFNLQFGYQQEILLKNTEKKKRFLSLIWYLYMLISFKIYQQNAEFESCLCQ